MEEEVGGEEDDEDGEDEGQGEDGRGGGAAVGLAGAADPGGLVEAEVGGGREVVVAPDQEPLRTCLPVLSHSHMARALSPSISGKKTHF